MEILKLDGFTADGFGNVIGSESDLIDGDVCRIDNTIEQRWYRTEDNASPIPAWDEFDFRKRFTSDERKSIMLAAQVNADIADFEAMLSCAGRTNTMIKSNDPLLNEAMSALVLAGLLTAERKTEILSQ